MSRSPAPTSSGWTKATIFNAFVSVVALVSSSGWIMVAMGREDARDAQDWRESVNGRLKAIELRMDLRGQRRDEQINDIRESIRAMRESGNARQ